MTTITIYKTSTGNYKGFISKGHARYAGHGKDIVCASVSVLIINTLNALTDLVHEDIILQTDETTGFIKCEFPDSLQESSVILMDAMVLGLDNISREYGKQYVKLNFKEV